MRRTQIIAIAATFLALLALAWPACNAAEYGDVVYQRKAQAGMEDVPSAVFPHWIHRMQYKCSACHDEPFKMRAGGNEVTMEMIQSGKSCGLCHNGKAAFESNFDTCQRCHFR